MTTMPYAEWQRQRGCDRKVRWDSEALATNWAILRSWHDDQDYRPYRCPHCEAWHITHQPAREDG